MCNIDIRVAATLPNTELQRRPSLLQIAFLGAQAWKDTNSNSTNMICIRCKSEGSRIAIEGLYRFYNHSVTSNYHQKERLCFGRASERL